MDAFSYLSVLISIIVGLAITQVLQGVRSLVLARGTLKPFLPSLLWTGLIVVFCIQTWWASFGLREVADWSFAGFTTVVIQTLCLYLLAALVLPDIPQDAPVDLRAHYFRQRGWFFGVLLLMLAVSLLKDVVLSGHLPGPVNVAFHGLFAAGAAVALATRSSLYHHAHAFAVAASISAYIALLFARL